MASASVATSADVDSNEAARIEAMFGQQDKVWDEAQDQLATFVTLLLACEPFNFNVLYLASLRLLLCVSTATRRFRISLKQVERLALSSESHTPVLPNQFLSVTSATDAGRVVSILFVSLRFRLMSAQITGSMTVRPMRTQTSTTSLGSSAQPAFPRASYKLWKDLQPRTRLV